MPLIQRTSSPTSMAINDSLTSYMSHLLKTSDHADVTIRSGSGWETRAHKAIVSQCGFFAGACRKDSVFVTGIVEMPDDEPVALAALVEFLYTCDYSLDATSANETLLAHVKVYGIADKYCLPSLQQLAASKFVAEAEAPKGLHSSDAESLKLDFLNAIEYLYASTPDYECFDDLDQSGQLRFKAVVLAKQHSDVLFRRSTAGEAVYSQAKRLLHEYPAFAIDMALTPNGSSSMALMEKKMSLVPTETIIFNDSIRSGSTSSTSSHPDNRPRERRSSLMIDRFRVLW